MSGIAGIISPRATDVHESVIKLMTDELAHRGPDGEGCWISPKMGAALGHRRLHSGPSLSQQTQPFHYLDRYSIVHDGQLSNQSELRNELRKAGYRFAGESDAEVIMAAYDFYKERCLQYLEGPFSFAIWDEVEQLLFAARDRFGEKPFYFFREKEKLVFASEMKAIWKAGVAKQLENKMLINYLAIGLVQHASDKSQTFYANICSLPPSHYLQFHKGRLKSEAYWSLDKQYEIKIGEKEALEKTDDLLSLSVSGRMRHDMPTAVSLSGGIDSAAILYYLQQQQKTTSSFSAVFPGFEKDESAFIKKITEGFHQESFTTTSRPEAMMTDFEKLMYHQEEPIVSSAIYAQFDVFRNASQQQNKIMLHGCGADEIFAGHNKYIHWYLQEMINRYRFLQAVAELNQFRKHQIQLRWDFRNMLAAFLPSHVAIALEKRAYNQIVFHPDLSRQLLSHVKGREWEGIHKPIITKLNDILYFDVMQMGLEEQLRYADRNAMAHGMEASSPYLGQDLVSFVFSIPSRLKIKDGHTKYIFRKLMQDRLPGDIVWKTAGHAYETPQKHWMENPAFKEYLFEARKKLVYHNLLRPESLQRKYRPVGVGEPNSYEWRYLCVAAMLG